MKNEEYKINAGRVSYALSQWNCLRGLAALWIVLGHCSMVFDIEIPILYLMHKFNLVWVGVFFFLSGYGLYLSREKKDDYMKGFLFKKCKKIILMTLVVFLFDRVLWIILGQVNIVCDIKKIIISYVSFTNWYMWELLFFYVLFYISEKILNRDEHKLFFLFVMTLLMMLIMRQSTLIPAYYMSALSFVWGCTFYLYASMFERIFFAYRRQLTIVLLLVLVVCIFSVRLQQNSLMGILGRNLMCVAFCSFGTLILSFLKPLSLISPYIYLYQFTYLDVFNWIWLNYKWDIGIAYVVAVAGATLMTAIILYYILLYGNKICMKIR